jgi:PAS domain S-box-containing protein
MTDRNPSEADRFEACFKHALDAMLLLDDEGRIRDTNPAASRLTGYERGELRGRTLIELSAVPDLEIHEQLWGEFVAAGQQSGELSIRRKNGSTVHAEYRMVANVVPGVHLCIVSDVTDRKRAEEAVRETGERYRTLMEEAPFAVEVYDAGGTLRNVNRAWERMWGARRDERLGRIRALEDPRLEPIRPLLERALAGERVEIPDTEIPSEGRTVCGHAFRIAARDGRQGDLILILDDVTTQRRAEEALRFQAMLLDQSSDYIIAASLDGRVTYVNAALCGALGKEATELIGTPIQEVFPLDPDEEISDREVIEAAFTDHHWSGMRTLLHSDGTARKLDIQIKIVKETSGQPSALFAIGRDTTEQWASSREKEKLEQQLLQAQKMEAIGRLAGGVAHDFNNIITGIQCYSDIILECLSAQDPLRADVDEIRRAADRAAGLTQQLLAFSRKQVIVPRVINLNQLLDESRKMLGRLIGEDVELSLITDVDLERIKADPHQVEQVLFNIAVNARDAMTDGGKLIVETSNVTMDDAFCSRNPGAVPGDYVLLSIADTGTGMDEDTRRHIFEPFFTTKEKGKGTGLGMSTVYGIVKQNNGYIAVDSAPGEGTTFSIYLPRVDAPEEERRPSRGEVPFSGDETILLVEDEDVVRRLAKKILTRKGYKVIEADRGGDAFLMSQDYEGRIDLLLTDVVMPNMNGKELLEKIKGVRPEIKAVFMSGYTGDVIVHHGILDAGVEFIQKPFNVESLSRKVREVLDK